MRNWRRAQIESLLCALGYFASFCVFWTQVLTCKSIGRNISCACPMEVYAIGHLTSHFYEPSAKRGEKFFLNPRRVGAPKLSPTAGGVRRPLSNSAPRGRREKRKIALESLSKIISKLLLVIFFVFAQVNVKVTGDHQRSNLVNAIFLRNVSLSQKLLQKECREKRILSCSFAVTSS